VQINGLNFGLSTPGHPLTRKLLCSKVKVGMVWVRGMSMSLPGNENPHLSTPQPGHYPVLTVILCL